MLLLLLHRKLSSSFAGSTLSCLFREKSVTIVSKVQKTVIRGQAASDHG